MSVLKELRAKRGLSQKELAEKAGLKQSQISLFEKGLPLNEKHMGKLIKAFDLNEKPSK